MCNHCFEMPTAAVRVVTSPENCQGARATEEIASAPGGDGEDDDAFFQLCVGEDGIEEGEEVTISYGPWPNDPFFLYFGFVPQGNPNDAVVLFDDVADVAACAARLGLLSLEQEQAAIAAAAAADESGGGDAVGAAARGVSRRRMVITREGVDPSVVAAAAAVGLEGWEGVVEGRCRELLREYPTKLKEDRAMLFEGRVKTQNEVTSVLYRMSKKEVLLGPLAAAAAAAAAAREAEAA